MVTSPWLIAPLGTLLLLTPACGGSDQSAEDATSSGSPAADCPSEGDELAATKLYIEHNATDADTGVHALLGAEGWTRLCVTAPDGQLIMVAEPHGALGALGVADLFWESREPEDDEYSIDELKADFPEGDYGVGGIDIDGNELHGVARFTHDIPAAPVITGPAELAEDEDEIGGAVYPAEGFEVTWEPVIETIDGEPVTISAYEVIVTDDAFEDPHGLAKPVYDVHVGPDVTSLSVPPEFFRSGTLYELEVLALEESGNQTISLGFFTIE